MKKSELKKYIKENILSTLSESTEDEIEKTKELTSAVKDLNTAKKEAGIEEAYGSRMPSQAQVDKFFALTQNETHYLNSKPVAGQEKTFNDTEVEPWDEYDLSNFNSLVRKAKQRGKSIDENEDEDVVKYKGEDKNITFGDFLDDLDNRFVDILRAAKGVINMRATLNQNFTLFRNYISALKKEYSDELGKELTFSIEEMSGFDMRGIDEGNDKIDREKIEGILWDLKNSNKLSNPSDPKKKEALIKKLEKQLKKESVNEDDDAEPTKKDIKKTKGLAKAKEELALLTREMKSLAKKYSKAEGEEKEKLVKTLKAKTKLKKELESILDNKKI